VATVATFFSGNVGCKADVWRARQSSFVDRRHSDASSGSPPTVVGFFLLLLLGRRSLIGHALEQIGI